MRIAGLQKNSTLDFPGVFCCVIFTAGCNYDCYYCHNRALITHPPLIDNDKVLSFLEKRVGLIEGVVLSGGEPTLQDDVVVYASALKQMGYKVKLDTNGSHPDVVEALLRSAALDYVALDYKAPFSAYQKVCGVPADGIYDTLSLLTDSGVAYEIRTTMIPEITPAVLQEMARAIPVVERYALQLYRPQGDSSLEQVFYAPPQLHELAKQIEPFQPNVCVRA